MSNEKKLIGSDSSTGFVQIKELKVPDLPALSKLADCNPDYVLCKYCQFPHEAAVQPCPNCGYSEADCPPLPIDKPDISDRIWLSGIVTLCLATALISKYLIGIWLVNYLFLKVLLVIATCVVSFFPLFIACMLTENHVSSREKKRIVDLNKRRDAYNNDIAAGQQGWIGEQKAIGERLGSLKRELTRIEAQRKSIEGANDKTRSSELMKPLDLAEGLVQNRILSCLIQQERINARRWQRLLSPLESDIPRAIHEQCSRRLIALRSVKDAGEKMNVSLASFDFMGREESYEHEIAALRMLMTKALNGCDVIENLLLAQQVHQTVSRISEMREVDMPIRDTDELAQFSYRMQAIQEINNGFDSLEAEYIRVKSEELAISEVKAL